MLSGRGLRVEPTPRPEEYYQLCASVCVCVPVIECDIETSKKRLRSYLDCFATKKKYS